MFRFRQLRCHASIALFAIGVVGTASAADIRSAVEAMQAGRHAEALAEAKGLAAAGNPDAEYILGYLSENGLATEVDIGAAVGYYASAASKGQANAQFALGELAYNGTYQAAKVNTGMTLEAYIFRHQ